MQTKIKAILWTYKETSKGEHEIRLRLTLYKEVVYIYSGFTSTKQNWDNDNSCPKSSHPKFKVIIKKIGDLAEAVEFEIRLMLKNGIDVFSLSEIKSKVKAPIKQARKAKVLEFYQEVIDELEKLDRIGYSKTFQASKGNLKKFLNGIDKSFISFTKSDFENYEQFLLKNIKQDTTISVYLRTFTRLWNIAIEKGFCPKEHHPSKFFKFKPYRRFKTKKRAFSADVLKNIEDLIFDKSSREYKSQQYFLFSYYARGINFIDLAKLKGENVRGNELTYVRSKNKRHYQFQLHSKAIAIAKIFMSDTKDFIFPILTHNHDTPKKVDARIDSALKDLNEDLGKIGNLIGLQRKLTSYAARHSFATNLRHKNVNISIIQEALGHETEL